ncbi:MAG: hypothetical protein KAJ10_02910 [Thermodesulfovibrionia bacterium]|nr:hypothetical protein [Thermodesulfovibrionia bacterium]
MITENEDFEYFKVCVKKWIEYFGLYNWEVCVTFEDNEDDTGSLAFTSFIVDNRRADIALCADWGDTEMTEFELDKTAFHEVTEILLLNIRYLAGKREYNEKELDGAIHSVIRILTAKIFEQNR